ncbi:MAG TPA: MFS transporter [Bacteroidales bacterium]|nr:MFS transporter [Bacteroidales bacterium]
MTEKLEKLISDSKATRWTVLFLVSFTMLAAYYFVDAIAPLELLLEQSYKWTPDNYGFFSGSEYMLNICGFLILSGIILDKMGIRFTGLLSCCIMLLGGSIKVYALSEYYKNGGFAFDFFNSFWPSLPATAKLAAVGYAIFGVGVEMCGITVSRTVVKWFKGRELALAMGMQLSTARLGASCAFFFSALIAGYKENVNMVDGITTVTYSGHVINPIILGLALMTIGFLTFLIYTFQDRKLDKQTGRTSDADPSEAFRLSDLKKIITNPGFWAISFMCVLFYSGVFPFLKYAVPMMQSKLGVSPEMGGMISGLLPVGTIILTPIFGSFLDRKGKGASIMILGSLILMLAHLIFALVPLNLVLAICSILLLGIAFSLIPSSMWPSLAKIIPEKYLGSAYALVFFIQNIGLWFIPWFIGMVLNWANPGVSEKIAAGDPNAVYNYTVPMLVFAALGLAAVVLGFWLKSVDKKQGYGLELPNIKK